MLGFCSNKDGTVSFPHWLGSNFIVFPDWLGFFLGGGEGEGAKKMKERGKRSLLQATKYWEYSKSFIQTKV